MSTLAAIVPFDLFGHAGCGAGAQLLADALREMLDDNRRERQPTRARSYQHHVRIKEFTFETNADYQNWLPQARITAKQSLAKSEFLLWLGGNHMSVLPVLEELGAWKDSLVVQFDAHLDIYNLTDCTKEPSHGNFLLHADSPLPPIIHLGHRDLFLPAKTIAKHFRTVISAEQLARSRGRAEAGNGSRGRQRVWIDIDCDVLDPAYFPAVGGPQPFGLRHQLYFGLIDAIGANASPASRFPSSIPPAIGTTAALVCWWAHRMAVSEAV